MRDFLYEKMAQLISVLMISIALVDCPTLILLSQQMLIKPFTLSIILQGKAETFMSEWGDTNFLLLLIETMFHILEKSIFLNMVNQISFENERILQSLLSDLVFQKPYKL